jgi:hypothetical protein
MSFGKGKNEEKLWCGQSGALIKMEKNSENIFRGSWRLGGIAFSRQDARMM